MNVLDLVEELRACEKRLLMLEGSHAELLAALKGVIPTEEWNVTGASLKFAQAAIRRAESLSGNKE